MKRREFISLFGGAAATWPLAARSQQTATPHTIGILVLGNPDPVPFMTAFREGLRDLGYTEKQDIRLEFRSAGEDASALNGLAAELVRLKVDIIVAWQTPPAQAAKQATKEIPIVMTGVGDPVATGLIASLAHPGGNVTGNTAIAAELQAKVVELIRVVGTVNRLRRKWLDEHKDLWRPYKTVEDGVAVLRPRIEGGDIETIPGTPSSSKLLSDTRLNTNGTEVSLPTPTKALLPAHEPALVTLPAVIGPQAVSTRDEIIIGGRRLISDRRVAAVLGVSKRTLQRWRQENKGPPWVKIGRRIYYDEDKLKASIQDR